MAGHANEIQRIRRGGTFVSSGNLVRTGGDLASAAADILLLLGHLLELGGDPEYGRSGRRW